MRIKGQQSGGIMWRLCGIKIEKKRMWRRKRQKKKDDGRKMEGKRMNIWRTRRGGR